jgi:hypothetical protein
VGLAVGRSSRDEHWGPLPGLPERRPRATPYLAPASPCLADLRDGLADARRLLASWLDRPRFRVEHAAKYGPDLIVDLGAVRLVVEMKLAASGANIGAAVQQVKRYAAEVGRRSVGSGAMAP